MTINERLREGYEPAERLREPTPLWDALTVLMKLAFVGVVLWLVFRCFGPNEERIRSLRREVAGAEQRLTERTRLRDDQADRIRLLKTDPSAVERAARDALNLGREEELIFRFDPPRKAGE